MKLKYQMRGLGIGIIVTALLMGVATGKGLPLTDAEIRAKASELGMVEGDSLKLTDFTNAEKESDAPSSTNPEETGEDGMQQKESAPGESASKGTEGGDSEGEMPFGAESTGEEGQSTGAEGMPSAAESAGEEGQTSGTGSSGEGGVSSVEGTAVEGGQISGTGSTGAEAAAVPSDPDASDQAGSDGNSTTGNSVIVSIQFGMESSQISQLLEDAGLIEDAAAFDSYLCSNGYSRKITAGTYEIKPGTTEEEIIQMITQNR